MLNPITGKRIYLLAYVIIWMVIAIIQMCILVFVLDIEVLPAITDSIVSNTIRGLIGIVIWFPVRFNPVSSKNLINPILAILVTGIFTIFVWTGSSYLILKNLFPENTAYISFLQDSVYSRLITDFLLYTNLVLIYSLIVYSINLKDKISEEANLKTLVREAELNMLKAQINPHFLFNSLNSISLLTKKAPSDAREMIIKLSDYLRYSLRSGQESTIPLSEEIENMERYLDIEKIRFGNKLIYNKNIPDNSFNFLVPNMILQPLIENAIKHGVYESTGPITITINAQIVGKNLEISIENNFDPDTVGRKGAGLGLKNVASRLQHIYSRTDLLNFKKLNEKFRVEVIIPPK